MINRTYIATETRDALTYTGQIYRSPQTHDFVSIAELVGREAALRPSSLAVCDDRHELTFLDLDQQSNRLARYIRAFGVGPDVPVALYFQPSVEFVVAALATLKAGGAYVPLDPSHPPLRLESVIKHTNAPLLLSHRHMAAKLPAGPWKTVDIGIDAAAIEHESPEAVPVYVESHHLAYIIYTSGSTGHPKGVEVTHANLLHLVHWHQCAFSVNRSDRASQIASVAFDGAVWETWCHVTAGASLHIVDEVSRRSPEHLKRWLLANNITIAFVPPIFAEQLIAADWPPSTTLRILLTGADTLHRRPKPDLPFVLVNNYGPTECTVLATSGIVRPIDSDIVPSIGRPINDTELLIMDAALNRLPHGDEGEICICGPQVARGYRNLPELTAEKFVADPITGERLYRTGDRGRVLADGDIQFLGRIDDQIKIRGFRVEPGEVTAQLNSYPGISTSVAVPCGDSADETRLVAYLVLEPGCEITVPELRSYLQSRLPEYMIPSAFVHLPSLPVTTNGKCDKQALPAPAPGNLLRDPCGAETPTQSIPVATKAAISRLISGLLNERQIDPHDNFFLLGGHSLMAAQLLARLRETFAVSLNLRQLFEAPTIASLAEVIDQRLVSK